MVYAEARYYNPTISRFTQQDPSHIYLAHQQFKNLIGIDRAQILLDPQQLNSYSYVRNNPIVLTDPSGRYIETAFDVAMFSLSLNDFRQEKSFWNGFAVVADGASLVLPIPALVGAVRHADDAARLVKGGDRVYQASSDVASAARKYNWANALTLEDHVVRHAADFGLKSDDLGGYAKASNNFIKNADMSVKHGDANFDSFVSEGKSYFFDDKNAIFAIRNSDGKTVTAYKPYGGNKEKARKYWQKKKSNTKK